MPTPTQCYRALILIQFYFNNQKSRKYPASYKSYNKITQFVARNFPQLQKQLR